MAPTGRQPYDTTEPTIFGVPSGRIRPPPGLGGREKEVFSSLVAACPAAQFQPSDTALICRWAESVALAEQAAGELEAGGVVTSDGKVSPWFTVHQRASKTVSELALRLRLGPQSRAPRAPKTKARPLSYYEMQALEESEANGQGEEDAPTRDQSN
jgi:hypothetical protein